MAVIRMARLRRATPASPRACAIARHRRFRTCWTPQTEALTQAALNKALEGDTAALRLCLERICPAKKDAPVRFDIGPMQSAADASAAAGSIIDAVASGDLIPIAGAGVMGLIDSYRRAIVRSGGKMPTPESNAIVQRILEALKGGSRRSVPAMASQF